MTSYSYELNSGYFISLAAFALHLKDMSHDDHQWAIVPIPGIFHSSSGEPRSFALLGYSNPSLGLLNALCFVVPLVALGGDGGSEPELIVSFSPRSITPLTRGLYIEEGAVKYDFLEDWERVWYPIKRQLWPNDRRLLRINSGLAVVRGRNGAVSGHDPPLPEDTYREEFLSYLTTMSRVEGTYPGRREGLRPIACVRCI